MNQQCLPANEIHVWSWARGLGRRQLLDVLGGYEGRALREADIACTALGKPFLPGSALEFSMSHSGAWTALAVSVAPVGLDIERVLPLPDLDDVAAISLGPLESKALAACAAADREGFFYGCWTRKEALLKGMGCGLAVAPRLADTLQERDWQFHELTGIAGWTGCVATRLPAARLVVRSAPASGA